MRQMKHIRILSDSSGARKRRMKIARQYVTKISGLDMHDPQDRLQLLAETMNKTDILKILRLEENSSLRKMVLKDLLNDINSVVDASQIVETCDTVGVSRRGYRAWQEYGSKT